MSRLSLGCVEKHWKDLCCLNVSYLRCLTLQGDFLGGPNVAPEVGQRQDVFR